MKATVLNGSRIGDDSLKPIHETIVDELKKSGSQIDQFILREIKIANCMGCFGCWLKTPGICVIDDAAREIAKKFVQNDLVIFLTPITFGGYSYELKKALDRIICVISPLFTKVHGEVHHKKRYKKYPSLLAIGTLPGPDAESEKIFTNLVLRNVINMTPPSYASAVFLSGISETEIKDKAKILLEKVGVKS